MSTRKIFGYGTHTLLCAIAVVCKLAVSALFLSGCENPIDSLVKSDLTGSVSLNNNSPKAGDSITATYAPGNGTGAQTWQWFRVGTGTEDLIQGATANTYTATAADVGKKLKAQLSFDDQNGSLSATTTNAVAAASASGSDITYTVAQSGGADGTATTTAIVFTFSASVDSLGLTAADITVGESAAKGASAALTGTGATRTLSPITVSHAGQAIVSIAKTGIEAGTKHVTVYKAGEAAPTLTGITAVYTPIAATVYPTTPLNDLKAGLVVKAQYSNNSDETLSANEYALSGTLTAGASSVTVTYQTKTTTFNVTVTALAGITVVYTPDPNNPIFTDTDKHTLKDNLTVTASYSDGAAKPLGMDDYDVSDLTEGNDVTITVTYTEGGVTKTDTFTVTVYPPHTHNWGNWTQTTAPTCTDEGEERRECSGTPTHHETRAIDALGHDEGEWHTTKDATCTEAGAKELRCTHDQSVLQTKTITALGHDWGEWEEAKAPTCTEAGDEKRIYKRDPEHEDTGTGNIPALGHDYAWDITLDPTCTTKGARTGTCSRDGSTTEEEIPIDLENGHDWNDTYTTITPAGTATDGLEAITCKRDATPTHTKDPRTLYATGGATTGQLTFTAISGVAAYRVSRGTAEGAIVIPAYYRPNATSPYRPVTTISANAFSGTNTAPNTTVTSITFAPGNQLTIIGQQAFAYCTGLASITLPDSDITITGTETFRGSGLTSITIPAGVTTIVSSMFQGCTSLTEITLPASLTSIGIDAFNGCSALASIIIPEGVTYIGNTAFSNCAALTSITLPVTTMGTSVFSNTPNIKTVTFIDGPSTTIGSAFAGMANLTSVTIPNSVTSIGSGAFANCTGLTSITIPASVTTITNNSFNGCTSLTNIIIDTAFSGMTSWSATNNLGTIFPASGLSVTFRNDVPPVAFYSATANSTKLASVTLAQGVTSIGANAFQNNTGLTSITIPASITSIGEYAFAGTSLTGAITITAGTIGTRAFTGLTGLTGVTFGEGVTTIGAEAFRGCTGITGSIIIPAGSIGLEAFALCNLTSVTIGAGVTSIGQTAFGGCDNLASVTFQGTIASDQFAGGSYPAFLGDLRDKYLAAGGGIGTYTTPTIPVPWNAVWTKQ